MENGMKYSIPTDVVKKYGHSGKYYNGEPAIISLTTWKARIHTVGITLFSLLTQCPGFHIVLVLSDEEFPEKEKELPDELMLFVKNNLIELLWVYKNYRSFKKVLFTMDKYRDVPVISADDDCIYIKNYAETLYNHWINKKETGIYYISNTGGTGWGALFTPNIFKYNFFSSFLKDEILNTNNDDVFYIYMLKKLKFKRITLDTDRFEYVVFHDELVPISAGIKISENNKAHDICKRIILKGE